MNKKKEREATKEEIKFFIDGRKLGHQEGWDDALIIIKREDNEATQRAVKILKKIKSVDYGFDKKGNKIELIRRDQAIKEIENERR